MAAIVLAINLPESLIKHVQALPPSSYILKGLVLPYSTYLVLSAIGALALAVHKELREKRPAPPQLPRAE